MTEVAARIAKVIRHSLLEQVLAYRHQKVALALSGGVDSCSILAAMLAAKMRPTIVSYTPSTHRSTDYLMAKECAEAHDLPFNSAVFPMEPSYLESCAREVIKRGYTSKVQVECLTPLFAISATAHQFGAKFLFTGDQADGYFALSKWASHNADRAAGVPKGERTNVQQDTTPERIDHLRQRYWDLDKSCSEGVRKVGALWGLQVVVPYRDRRIYNAFRGALWREVNKPRLKEPIRLAFEEELLTIPTRKNPVNLHKGDSEFAHEMGRILLAQKHLQGPWTTTTGLYRAMARGEV